MPSMSESETLRLRGSGAVFYNTEGRRMSLYTTTASGIRRAHVRALFVTRKRTGCHSDLELLETPELAGKQIMKLQLTK